MKIDEIRKRLRDAIEKRTIQTVLEARNDTGEKPGLVGYAARFNKWSENLGGFRERIKPGAFTKALQKSDVRMLYNHDSNNLPLARTPKTLRLTEDDKGLWSDADLPDIQLARDLLVSVSRGDISEMSFQFYVADDGDEWTERNGIISRTIVEVEELFDVSPVVFPAYKSTNISKRAFDQFERLSAEISARNRKSEIALTAGDEQRNLEIDILLLSEV